MSLAPHTLSSIRPEDFYRLSVEQYHSLIESGSLSPEDRIELIGGLLIQKMPKNPLHEAVIAIVTDILKSLLPSGWSCRAQGSVTLSDSEPEPDVAIFRGRHQDYLRHHPGPADVAVVIEVADSSLRYDRTNKLAMYARASIATYLVLDLASRTLAVHTQPDVASGTYRALVTLTAAETLTIALPGANPIRIPVASMLPEAEPC
jgi:Uma2 family endonuclease